jgi:flavin-dependent dehydrogenase
LQFDKPLTISQVSFEENCVDDHILMIGDTTLVYPSMCGNGMAMAIHSAKIASDLVIRYRSGKKSKELLEK